ncbi:hypothetical protein DSO57_1006211 [Entomophthora muscae]|uniref:Uncharacterized protein n=1 Tax=Entomophthora muscae TaxID=34485 RepID=A0ACC2S9L1_9FUNG|nr:hypothetical protein DSO57_1006211 [Entomophthora muscae]
MYHLIIASFVSIVLSQAAYQPTATPASYPSPQYVNHNGTSRNQMGKKNKHMEHGCMQLKHDHNASMASYNLSGQNSTQNCFRGNHHGAHQGAMPPSYTAINTVYPIQTNAIPIVAATSNA